MVEYAQIESGSLEENRSSRVSRRLLEPSRLARSLLQAGVHIETTTLRGEMGRRFGLHAGFCTKRQRVARLVFGQCLTSVIEKSWKLACDINRRWQSQRHLCCGITATARPGIKCGAPRQRSRI